MHFSTFHGLHQWHQKMFEKLGWVILAKEYGHIEKVKCYIDSVNHLEQNIIQKISVTKDKDKIQDLEILLQNVKILQNHINKDFASFSFSRTRK